MKIFANYTFSRLSNSYLIGPDKGGDAVLVDAGLFSVSLLKLVEDSNFDLRYILLTHAHDAHTDAVNTIMRIYEPTILGLAHNVRNYSVERIEEGKPLCLGEFSFNVFATPGHSPDSAVFKLDRFLFTGDTLYAGSIGRTHDDISRALIISSISEKVLSLDDDHFVFPGHGPPSTVGIERNINPELRETDYLAV